ncbi:hypothetical protein NQ315_007930 [Exocentrus adspersus]|uniref:Uncharacterized protein n=1 Tax=Exocentrus adspersus TaxID=1586481 RepID=A0AAV8W8R6_9CUCU|nr:hypothetical protein NQ315_007883 [Exocentrus adspersus]KAJ8922894.1 hypothetical protein NQ315_007930 [Exocentrus adspersus]
MIIKNPKPSYRRWLKKGAIIIFAVEGVCFAGSYFLWYKTNTQRDFRKHLRDNYPAVLEVYYKTGELIDSKSNIREIDQVYWDHEKF